MMTRDERRICALVECTGMPVELVRDVITLIEQKPIGSIAMLDSVLGMLQLAAPVSLEDCGEIQRELRERLPVGIPMDIVIRGQDRVEVVVGLGEVSVLRTLVAR